VNRSYNNGYEYEHLEYTPYGETWFEESQEPMLNKIAYKFTGKELDTETGLYYFGARYYDPKVSRWISCDPAFEEYLPVGNNNRNLPGEGGIFNPINLALYHYAGNNPIKYVDPNGKSLLSNIKENLMSRLFEVLVDRNGQCILEYEEAVFLTDVLVDVIIKDIIGFNKIYDKMKKGYESKYNDFKKKAEKRMEILKKDIKEQKDYLKKKYNKNVDLNELANDKINIKNQKDVKEYNDLEKQYNDFDEYLINNDNFKKEFMDKIIIPKVNEYLDKLKKSNNKKDIQKYNKLNKIYEKIMKLYNEKYKK